jgi:hypothetical protein
MASSIFGVVAFRDILNFHLPPEGLVICKSIMAMKGFIG